MAEITAQAVNEFRKATGLGLMECKTLLREADGDLKKAMTLAKERGLKNAEKRAGRSAKAGRIEAAFSPDHSAGVLIELNCETDFVARNDEFRQTARELAEHFLTGSTDGDLTAQAFAKDPARTIREVLVDLNARTGENVSLARAVKFAGNGWVDAYVHHDGKSGALVEIVGGNDPQLVKDLALQVVASTPLCVRRDELAADVIAEQKRIFVTQAADKPEAVREKIAEGKLNAWYGEVTLLDQPFVKDSAKPVREVIKQAGPDTQVTRFARFVVGDTAAAEA